MKRIKWGGLGTIRSKKYSCGYCGTPIASEKGWGANENKGEIYICHLCTKPTFFDNFEGGKQWPGAVHGNPVSDIPDKTVSDLYEEARSCTGVCAFTAAILCCRKLLMNVAVAKGADIGKSFLHYVDFLADQHFVPPDAKEWVDHIRQKGNEANHEILIMSKEEAEELLDFCEMLLKIIYEFPATAKKRYPNQQQNST